MVIVAGRICRQGLRFRPQPRAVPVFAAHEDPLAHCIFHDEGRAVIVAAAHEGILRQQHRRHAGHVIIVQGGHIHGEGRRVKACEGFAARQPGHRAEVAGYLLAAIVPAADKGIMNAAAVPGQHIVHNRVAGRRLAQADEAPFPGIVADEVVLPRGSGNAFVAQGEGRAVPGEGHAVPVVAVVAVAAVSWADDLLRVQQLRPRAVFPAQHAQAPHVLRRFQQEERVLPGHDVVGDGEVGVQGSDSLLRGRFRQGGQGHHQEQCQQEQQSFHGEPPHASISAQNPNS